MTSSFDTLDERRQKPALQLALRHYLHQIRRQWPVAVPALLLPGLGTILVFYVPPLLVAGVIEQLAADQVVTASELVWPLTWITLFWMGGELLWRLGVQLLIKTELSGSRQLYLDGMDYLLAKDLAFFHDNFAGSLTKRAIAYARSFEGLCDTIAFNVSAGLLPLVFVVPVLWGFSPWLVLQLVGMTFLTLVFVAPLIKRRQAMVDAREAAANRLAGHISDSIANMDAVRAFSREPEEAALHRLNVDRFISRARRSYVYQNMRIDMVTAPMFVLTNIAGLVIALAVGQRAGVGVEAVFVTFSYYVSFTRVMWEFNHIYRQVETYLTEGAQFAALLLEPPTVVDPPEPIPFRPSDAGVEFRNVGFRYHERGDEPLFDGFALRIAAGEKVGLVGRSGGGKSTITRLLLRFRDVDEGEILIGGQNIARVKQAELRSMISYVPQDPVMFHRSIRDNISFAREDVTEEEIREAARLAHADEFIDQMPNGYDTLIGERGVKLSGGQRQRVAIARAMLRGAPILILDEATSSLDSESEQLIQEALWNLMEGRTAIVIAHRLSTVQRMDRLVVLEAGRIVEQGTHQELLALGGAYAGLWASQIGGFLVDEPLPAPAG